MANPCRNRPFMGINPRYQHPVHARKSKECFRRALHPSLSSDTSVHMWLAAQVALMRHTYPARTRGLSIKAKDHYITQHEVEEIWMDVEKVTKGGWVDCFRSHDKTLYCTLLGMTLQSLRQLTGRIAPSSTVLPCSKPLDSLARLLHKSFWVQSISYAHLAACISWSVYILTCLPSSYCFIVIHSHQFGRRWPLICGGIWQSA